MKKFILSLVLLASSFSALSADSPIPVQNGGTGINSYTIGDMLYASATNALSKLGIGTASQVLIGGTTPSWLTYATSNTPSTLVARDSSGNFSAAIITASLSGVASQANAVSTLQVYSNAAFYVPFFSSQSNAYQQPNITGTAQSTPLTYNPVTSTLTAINFAGNASTATTATTATNSNNINTTASSSNTNFYLPFVASSSSGYQALDINSNLNYNPSAGVLTLPNITLTAPSANQLLGVNVGNQIVAIGAGTSTTILHGNASGLPTYGAVNLVNDVTGILPNGNTTAASANTASAVVARDSSGNFSAGTITAALTGNASTATTATNSTNVATTSTSTNASYYPLFVSSSSNSNQAVNLNSLFFYNPSTSALTVNGTLNASAASQTAVQLVNGGGISGRNTINGTELFLYPRFTDNKTYMDIGSAGATFRQNSAGSTWMSVDTSSNVTFPTGGVIISGLTASSLVATDGSKKLTSSTTALSPTFAGLNLTTSGILRAVITSTTTGSTNAADLALVRGDSANGFNRVIYRIGSTDSWSVGSRSGDTNYTIYDEPNARTDMSVNSSNGDIHAVTGNLTIDAVGKTLSIPNGTNACAGSGVVMSSGSATITSTCIVSGDIILLSKTLNGGTTTTGMPAVSSGAGSATVTGSSLDTSTYSWVDIHV